MDTHATDHKITPRSVSESAEIARRVIAHTTAQNVHFSMPAAVIAGLLDGIDQLAAERARLADAMSSLQIIDAELNCQADGQDTSATVEMIRELIAYRDRTRVALRSGADKPGSILDLQGSLKRDGQATVPIDDMRIGAVACVCGPDGCADSTCPGRCGGAA